MSGKKSCPGADYAIEFCTVAAESGWNPTALMVTFHQGLSEELKDELVHRDTSASLNNLINLVLPIENRVRQRRRIQGPEISRGSRKAPRTLSPVRVPDKHGESRSQPTQLEHTRLSRSERNARTREGRCLYCGSSGISTQLVLSSREKTTSLRGGRTSDRLNQSSPNSGVVPQHHNGLANDLNTSPGICGLWGSRQLYQCWVGQQVSPAAGPTGRTPTHCWH
ncbi:hypothetical protein P4O66_004540 [Electrophorus voltai]|uniref:Uncharacterized protein n=1 Tax=Electrophorus voltai TaxID=2609070 RepID=A0AAD8ZNN1_9TELE|nr:hypothetical protein P4O66_004540 [Electrophorus voltai]